MSEKPDAPSWWYHRKRGLIDQAVFTGGAANERAMRRAALLGRFWRGDPIGADQRADLSAMRAQFAAGDDRADPRNLLGGVDEQLGLLAFVRPDLLRRLDALALEIASAIAPRGLVQTEQGWRAVEAYAKGARDAVLEERFAIHEPAMAQAARADAEAIDSDAGRRAVAAVLTPDGGPEGWSQVPPRNPDFPTTHPLQAQVLRHLRRQGAFEQRRWNLWE